MVTRKMAAQTVSRNLKFVRNSASGDMETSSVGLDVSIPSDYSELIEQVIHLLLFLIYNVPSCSEQFVEVHLW